MIILALDYSMAKTGISVVSFTEKIDILYTELFVTDNKKENIERAVDTIKHIEDIRQKYNADLTIKESSIIGRASTATGVNKAHGALEYFFYTNVLPLEEVHNSTVKAWSREFLKRYMEKEDIKNLDKKEVVANMLEKFFTKEEVHDIIYTPRGKLLDDIADSVAIALVYYDKFIRSVTE